MKAYTLRKIEISMFILFYIFPKKLDYIKNLRKYCDSIIEKYLLIFDIRSIESIEVSTLQIDFLLGQFLQKSMSALERFRIVRSRIFTTSTRHNIEDSLRDWTYSHLLKTGTRLTAIFASEFRMMRHVGRECE